MKLEFDHVAVAVPELDAFRTVLERLTGREGSPTERVDTQGVDVCFVGPVEVIAPHDSASGVARFLEKRGAGLHHIAYRVEDLDDTMARLKDEGYRFTQEEAGRGRGGHRVAFLHPASTGGVLIEFLEHAQP